jgi:hypothetical protein
MQLAICKRSFLCIPANEAIGLLSCITCLREGIIMQYKVISIDVWGNEISGFEKNDFFGVGKIEVEEQDNFKDALVQTLIDEGFLKEKAKGRVVVDTGIHNYIMITEKNGRPVYDLQLIE